MGAPFDNKVFPSVQQSSSIRVYGSVIIGAGPAGLATAARHRKSGVPSIFVLESANSISSLCQSEPYISKKFCQLHKFPYPLSKRLLRNRLQSFAKKHQINLRFNVCVQSAKYDRTTRLWRVQTSTSTANDDIVVEYLCKLFVDSTGEYPVRVTPQIEGLSNFQGPVIHAEDYGNSEKISFMGKKVLVVACGYSRINLSNDLLKHKAFPIMLHPTTNTQVVHASQRQFSGFESAFFILLLLFSPLSLVEKLLLIMACFIMGYIMNKYWLARPSSMEPLELRNPILTFSTLAKIRSGEIKVVPGGIKRFDKGTIEFVNGEKHDIDAVVHTTGYRSKSKDYYVSKKQLKVPRGSRGRESSSSIRKKHAQLQTRPLETDLTDKKKNHVCDSNCGRKSQIGEENTIGGKSEVSQNLVPRNPPGFSGNDFVFEPITTIEPSSSVIQKMIRSTHDGLASGQSPTLSELGEGGAYFMSDSTGQKYVSVFKPTDEEPNATNNPRVRQHSLPEGEGLRKGTIVGQGAFMEFVAYLLDHPISGRRKFVDGETGFAGVPPTLMVKCLHKEFNHTGEVTAKTGSLQMFVENNGSCEDLGNGVFPKEEVHKITVLDMRLANADRHGGNILLIKKENAVMMVPIDHGYCLPTSFEDCTFEWLNWSQADEPYSQETIEYINSLDVEEDIALLKSHVGDLPIECVRTLRISTVLLKKGVERGMTPLAIGSLMCRELLNKKSMIEEIVQEARDSIPPHTSEAILLDDVSRIMDRRLDEILRSKSP